MNGLTEFLKDCLETVFTLTGSTVCLVGILVGLCIGYLAGAQVRRVRSIGSQRPKRKTGASGNIELYVGNLSYETDEDQLRRAFQKYGTVSSVRIIAGRFNHKSKGYGFVEMPKAAEADAAIKALNDFEFQGRKLRVNIARNTPA
jgi:hypothetical protein